MSQLLCVGPFPGDIAEVEAYCRIFRAAEKLHTVIMETLCNPETGECTVSYDITSDEKSQLEEKVVAYLGCLIALLNRGREDVLCGRSSLAEAFNISDVNLVDNKLPPLAVFRDDMKKCCQNLHVALSGYLPPFDERSINILRHLQRLKNVCYDAGFSRADVYPSPSIFANWGPVYFSSKKEESTMDDSEVAFWRGGQVTDEGLNWLIKKGFKTIVNLSNENDMDDYCKLAIEDAVLQGKIEVVNLPVNVGYAPTMEQVEIFASLVSDPNKRPLYLHSQEGINRASAMVSRWRQYISRSTVKLYRKPLKAEAINDSIPTNLNGSTAPDEHTDSGLKSDFANDHSAEKLIDDDVKVGHTLTSVNENIDAEVITNFTLEHEPLTAQFPVCDFFSRKEMRRFFKSRKISPYSHIRSQTRIKKLVTLPNTIETQTPSFTSNSQHPHLHENPHWSLRTNDANMSNIKNINSDSRSVSEPINHIAIMDPKFARTKSLSKNNGNVPNISSSDMGDEKGNMCASATGVVRIQSRKKAEMFLVRTDGFSCTREKVTESSLAFTHPTTQQQMLMWKSPPKTVLLLKKLGNELMEEAKEVITFLHYQENMNVLVEPDVHDILARIPGFGFVQTFYRQDTSDLHERVDLVTCLGGDGVILHASNLFRTAVPPVVSFNLGSLGFLTSHIFDEYKRDLKAVIHGNDTVDGVYITLRMRLRCEVFRNGKAMPGKVFEVLNEMVVDRGSNPYLSKIECYEHDRLITKVQGDGVIVATPTGSTAYSTAAGGSMVHPNVPCMLFTPICPHSLSFRPVILPDSARLELKIPPDTRSNAWVSFDGKRRQQLSRGDSVRISMSQHPLPTVNKSDQTGDWFRSLIRCLNWNERLDQKAL